MKIQTRERNVEVTEGRFRRDRLSVIERRS